MSKILTIRIDNDLESRLNRESVATGKSVSQILRDAYLAAQYKDGDSGGLERRIEAIIDQKLNAFHDTPLGGMKAPPFAGGCAPPVRPFGPRSRPPRGGLRPPPRLRRGPPTPSA